jgi:hypothetical protein
MMACKIFGEKAKELYFFSFVDVVGSWPMGNFDVSKKYFDSNKTKKDYNKISFIFMNILP